MWELESTEEFDLWIDAQEDFVVEMILSHIYVLKEKGPGLGRPYVDSIKGSKISNLKELRIQIKLKVVRIFFVFTKDRIGLLLAAGDKRGNKRFYNEMIPKVEGYFKKWEADNENGKSKEERSKKKRNRKA